MVAELTQDRVDWLNGFWTKQDFIAAGVEPKGKIKDWYKSRRWQIHRLCAYAANQEMPYENREKLGLIV